MAQRAGTPHNVDGDPGAGLTLAPTRIASLVQVEFELVQVASGGFQALNVRGANGESLSCEAGEAGSWWLTHVATTASRYANRRATQGSRQER